MLRTLDEIDIRVICISVFFKIGAISRETDNIHSVEIDGKEFLFAFCQRMNISRESLSELGIKNGFVISQADQSEPVKIKTPKKQVEYCLLDIYEAAGSGRYFQRKIPLRHVRK